MYPASVIAYAFAKKGIEEGNPVTQMKLQKMVYCAEGFHLAQYDSELIKERIQAWKFGPVVPSIYQMFKFYGNGPILDMSYVPCDNVELERVYSDEKAASTIQDTWNMLKDVNAIQLSNWTHKTGSPWDKHYKPYVSDIIIPKSDIKEYFSQFLVKNGQ